MDRGKATLSGERRVVTAMFCDVVGSTTLAEGMDPEDWGEFVAQSMHTMGEVIDHYGGTVSEFGGDAVVALFGAPVAHEDDPYRAVRAGLAIADRMRTDGSGLEVRVGIHTGLVVVGDITAGDYNTYSALGDTLNVASRLQNLAEPGGVVISADTRRLLGSDVEAHSLGVTDLKGRSAPIEVFAIDSVTEVEQRRRGLPDLSSPMVGRNAELDRIVDLAAHAGAGTGRIAVVMGEPGVGKTRLVSEAERRITTDAEALWVIGTCVPYDEDLPFHLIASTVRSLVDIGPDASADVAAKAIRDLTDQLDRNELDPTLDRLLGVTDDATDVPAEQLTQEYVTAVGKLFTAIAERRRPIVVILEDAHWADASSVEVISELLEWSRILPVLAVIVMRPDRDSTGWELLEAARRRLGESLVELPLQRLDADDSRSLVANLLEIDSLPSALRRLVVDKAEGNPFFLEEVVRMLVERDLVVEQDGRWVARPGIGDLEVPDTIQGLLASRVDLLPADTRRAGRVAAVIGRRFSADLFAEVYGATGDHRGGLHPDLAALEAHGMLRIEALSPELEYGFRHALIHDVMYEGLLRKERRVLHGQVASAIERRYADRIEEVAPQLGRHYAEAGQPVAAVPHLIVAAERALKQGARVESARFYGQAQDLLLADDERDDALLVDVVTNRLRAGMQFTPAPESMAWIDAAMPAARSLGDPDRLARLYERRIWTRSMQGESPASPDYRADLDAAYVLVPEVRDEATAALIHAMVGGVHRAGDEYGASVEPLQAAAEGLAAVGRNAEASYNAAMLAESLSQVGRFDEAIDAIDLATELAEESGDPNAILDADLIRGSILADRGELAEALDLTRRGIDAAEEVGNTFCNLAGNFKLADQQLRLGQVDSAIGHLEKATGLAQYCNAGPYEALGRAWLAAAKSRTGAAGPEAFDEPLEAAVASGSRSTEGLVRLQRAVALAAAGNHDEAVPDFERSIELFAGYGGLPNLARAHHAYGQALEAVGDRDGSTAHLRTAQQMFTDLGIQPDLVGGSHG